VDVLPVQVVVRNRVIRVNASSELHIVEHFGLQSLPLDVRNHLARI
jgi:hypothetical protein